MTLMEQLGNIGSEVERAIRAKERADQTAVDNAASRALELIDFTIADPRLRFRLKEIVRMREVLCDYLYGPNEYSVTPGQLQNEFLYYGIASRSKHQPNREMPTEPTKGKPEIPRLLTLFEAAEYLRVSKATIYRLVETRQIPFHLVGRGIRFTEEDLRRFLGVNRVEPITRKPY